MTKQFSRFLIIVACVAVVAVAVGIWWSHTTKVTPSTGGTALAASSSTMGAGAQNAQGSSGAASTGTSSSSVSELTSADQASAGNTVSTVGAPYYGNPNTAASIYLRVATTTVPIFSHESYLVRDVTSGVTLASQNTNARWPTASLTKLMTATLAIDQLNMSTTITITPQMMAVDPTQYALQTGGTYTVYDLLHAMVMPSNNVAAQAIADYIGLKKFLREMNARAAAWGMTNTHFEDPSGLSSANESTAHDLAILATHVYEHYPQILAFSNTPRMAITNLTTGKKTEIQSINEFAGTPGFIGGKTGYIPSAGDNLISLFRFHGKPLLIIVLGARDTTARFADTSKLLQWTRTDYQ